jgi:hypothetical protein
MVRTAGLGLVLALVGSCASKGAPVGSGSDGAVDPSLAPDANPSDSFQWQAPDVPPFPDRVFLPPDLAAPPPALYDGHWRGVTAREKFVALYIDRGRVVYARFGYWGRGQEGPGSSCEAEGFTESRDYMPITGGKFSGASSLPPESFTIAGTFSSESEVSGTLHYEQVWPNAPQPACVISYDTTWTATKQPPVNWTGTWSGKTSEDKPISLTVSGLQVRMVSFDFLPFTQACAASSPLSFSGAPKNWYAIVAGDTAFIGDVTPVYWGVSTTFTSATQATGTLRVGYHDPTVTPICGASKELSFSLTHQ